MGSGSYATWINSDDMLCKNALSTHFSSHELEDDVVYIGDCVNIDEAGNILSATEVAFNLSKTSSASDLSGGPEDIYASRRCSFRLSWRFALEA